MMLVLELDFAVLVCKNPWEVRMVSVWPRNNFHAKFR